MTNNNCDPDDYECFYTQTVGLSSDAQVACFSPRIPPSDRINLMIDLINPSFIVSLQVDGSSFTCANASDCIVQYDPSFTPILYTMEPTHFYVGQNLTFRATPYSYNLYSNMGLNRVGLSSCVIPELDEYTDNPTDMILKCSTGSNVVGKATNFTLGFYTGFAKITSFFQKQDLDPYLSTYSNYYYKVFARVDALQFNYGFPFGGQTQVIYGSGFKNGLTKVLIANDECIINSLNYAKIVCTTNPSTLNTSTNTSIFPGNRGLIWRMYSGVSSFSKMTSIPGFPNNLTTATKDDVLMETSTAPNQTNNYCQHFFGLFKAVYGGNYRFWSTSDDTNQVFLSNDTTSANNVKIIDFYGWTLYNDYITQYNSTRSQWITLTANQYYNFEIYHCQGSGSDHFRLGVEIDQTNNTSNNLSNPMPNQAYRTVSVNISPNIVFRDVYEILIPTLNPNTISINTNSASGTLSLKIDPTWTASNFRSALSNFMAQYRLIVRKMYLNELGQYYLGPNDKLDDSSFTSSYNFADMNINFDNLTALTSSPINTVSTGKKSGVVFLVLIDEKYSVRVNNQWENTYFFMSNVSSIQAKLNRKQWVSPDMSGFFKLNFTVNNVIFTTPTVNMTNIKSLSTIIDGLPIFTSKSQVWLAPMPTESFLFYISFGLYDDVSISVVINDSSTMLKGGRDSKVNVNIKDIIPEAGRKSLFFMPIPSDFLWIKNSNPQVTVIVNDLESVCRNCSYNYELASNLPKVISASYDLINRTVTLIIDKNFNDTSILPFMKIGPNLINKLNVTYSKANNIFSYIGNLSSSLIGGNYTPILSCDYGDILSVPNIIKVNIPISIVKITPSSANPVGGTCITITGTNFPLNITQDLSITAGGATCLVQTTSNTQISCIAGVQIAKNNSPLTISYQGQTVSANQSIFSYVTVPTKSIQSVTPNSVSPGEKQTITINFTSDISAFNISGISVKIIHTTISNYQIMMNVISVTNNTLKARFGGAAIGSYNLIINLDSVTNVYSPMFTSGFYIDSMNPNIGSINGGTYLTITGTNFLTTQKNQMIFIGKTPCVYVNNTVSTIVCTTAKPTASTPIDSDQSVVIDQMIQYASACNIKAIANSTLPNGCFFRYSSAVTATINNVVSSNNNYAFSLNDNITINGNNFNYINAPTVLNFKWGQITVTASDLSTQINGTITNISQYGLFTFNFYNDYGLATHSPTGVSIGSTNVQIFLLKPNLVVKSVSPISFGEYGSIFKFYSAVNDFTTNAGNGITICGTPCTILAKNLLQDNNTNFQCIISQQTPQDTFSNCKVVASYYGLSITLTLPLNPGVNNTNNNQILAVKINDIDISSSSFAANGITDSSNFILKIILNNVNIGLKNLKMIVDNRYVFPSSAGVIDSITLKALYSFNLTNGLPAGSWTVSFFEDTVGFLSIPNPLRINNVASSSLILKINLKLVSLNSPTVIKSSFYGGIIGYIKGVNLNRLITALDSSTDSLVTQNADSSALQIVLVCGFPATITSYNSTYISFSAPTLIKYDFFQKTSIINNSQILTSSDYNYLTEVYFNGTDSNLLSANLFDQNIYTSFKGNINTFIGIKIKQPYLSSNLKILLSKVKIHVGDQAKPGDYNNGFIEGSLDNKTWTKIINLPQNLPFLYNSFTINYPDGASNLFKYIRLNPNSTTVFIAELLFFGNIVYDDSTSKTASCNVSIVDNFNNLVINNYMVNYDSGITLRLKNITPANGRSVGGDNINLILSSPALKGTEAITISLFGVPVTQITLNNNRLLRSTQTILYNSITFTTPPRNNDIMDFTQPLQIFISGYGNVYTDILNFRYLDRWSDTATWGGEFIPANGETAYIQNCDILLDVPNINLNTLVIENGSLIAEDVRDYHLSAKNIMVRSGSFIVGTENSPFTHNFVLTLTSTRYDPTLPIFGNKVLAIMEGNLLLQGIPRNPVWTVLQQSAKIGENTITVAGPIDWVAGEEIVISSSSSDYTQSERLKIVSVDKTKPLLPVITLSNPLLFFHYGVIETYGTSDTIDMRAEVILLTRNIVVQGDSLTTDDEQYGATIMITSMDMDMNLGSANPFYGKIAYVELRKVGQAFQLGRYPIHFHMIGDVTGSYVKGCSIHDSFNRAITFHGVNNFLVDRNVAYNIMGHTFFQEDGVEVNNIITNNVGILTLASFSLLNTDFNPAIFWITNPSNYFEGNRACGSQFYGVWFELPNAPTGVSIGVKSVPKQFPLGSFKDNVAHSNGKYGIRIFPEWTPINKPGQPVDNINVFTVQALFQNITLYKNKEKGFVTERIGNMLFDNFKIADHKFSHFEVSNMILYPGDQPRVQNMFLVGVSKNPVNDTKDHFPNALTTPRHDNFFVSNIRFYNFGYPGYTLFASCSRCDISGPSTDSDARTIFFEKIQTDGSELSKVRWIPPRRAIYVDLDGTLTGQSTPGYVTPYYPHLLTKNCKRSDIWDDGLICDNTNQLRRIEFYNQQPSDIFMNQVLKIIRLPGTLDKLDNATLANVTNYSIIPFKEDTDPSFGWAIGFFTGYNYFLTFGNLGLDFNTITFKRSPMWLNSDTPLNLIFNYTERRDDFSITGTNNSNLSFNVTNATNIEIMNDLTQNTLPYGTYLNNINKNQLYIRVSGYNPKNLTNFPMVINGIQCLNNNCGGLASILVPLENFTRKWSDPSNWPNNKVPVDGDSVEVKAGWKMILDVSTANLNNLTINGSLTFDPTKKNLELKSQIIFIYYGNLSIGTSDSPYLNNASITLTGNRFSKNIGISSNVQLTNKILVNVGNLSIAGEKRGPYKTRLLSSVNVGDSIITVSPGLKWRVNDEIVVTTTTHFTNQTERFTIISYNSTSGVIILNSTFIYGHFGSSGPTILIDNPIPTKKTFDERAEVYMITRNIRVSGSYEGWGCNLYTTSYSPKKNSGFVLVGNTNISDAEFVNCGQQDTNYAPLQFNLLNFNTSMQIIDGVSIHDNNYLGISISNSANINISNTILYEVNKTGVMVTGSHNVTLYEISVVKLRNRYLPIDIPGDINICFVTCVFQNDKCTNFNLINSTCAGSQYFGFHVRNYPCSVDLSTNYNYLYSYATKVAAVWFFTDFNDTCYKSGNVVVYNNLGAGYATFILTDQSISENIISSNNLYGIIILSGPLGDNKRKQLKNSIIIGQNNDNPICFNYSMCWDALFSGQPTQVIDMNQCNQVGMFLSISQLLLAPFIPLKQTDIPVHNTLNVSSFGSFFDGINVTISNFEDKCPMNQSVFHSNDLQLDSTSIHNFYNFTLSRVLEDNLFLLNPPFDHWAGPECGTFPCTGPNNYLFKITNFIQPKLIQKNSDIVPNPKWKKAKKYANPDFDLSISNISEKPNYPLYSNNTIVPGSIVPLRGCSPITAWNASICNQSKALGVLIIENIEPEANTRNIAPMNYISFDPSENLLFNNTINMFMDHGCQNGYPTHLRVPRMVGVLYLNKYYNLSFSSINPSIMKVQLMDPDWVPNNQTNKIYSGVTMKLNYLSPQTVLVYNFNTRVEYKSKSWSDGEVFNLTYCGASKWTPVNNTLEFYVTNEPSCVLYIKQVDSVQMSLRFDMTVDDFYSKNSATSLIYNIAAILGIPPEQIRITSVMKGSAIALTSVLAQNPALSPAGSNPSSSSNTTGSSGTSSSSSSTSPTIDLTAALNTIVTSIKSGALVVPAPILSMSVTVTTGSPPSSTSSNSSNTNSSTSTSTGIGIILGNGSTVSINAPPITPNSVANVTGNGYNIASVFTNNGITIIVFNNTLVSTPVNNQSQSLPPFSDSNSIQVQKNNMNLLWLIVIPVVITLLALSWLAYHHLKKRRTVADVNQIDREPNNFDHPVNLSNQTIRQMQNDQIKKIPKDKSGYMFDGLKKLDDTIEIKTPNETPLSTINNKLSLNVNSEFPMKKKI